MNKGQGSVELIIILAVALTVLLAIFSVSNQTVIDAQKTDEERKAQLYVDTLSSTAKEVYSQGAGAKKIIYAFVPKGINQSSSGIEGESFVLNIFNSDIYNNAGICISGIMPLTYGGHWISFSSSGNCVVLGEETISLNKNSSYVLMEKNSSETDFITVTNNSTETAEIFLSDSWLHSNVSVNFTSSPFSLNSGESKIIDLNYSSDSNALGLYSGLLYVNAAFPTLSDVNLSASINAEILASSGGSSLVIFPANYLTSLYSGGSDSNSFNVCNAADSELTGIDFSITGNASSWINSISSIASLTAGECVSRNLIINVPALTSTGIYTAVITAEDVEGNSDVFEVTINVLPQSSAFEWDWSCAAFSSNTRLDNWAIENTGTESITLTRMKIIDFNINDLDGSQLDLVRFNGTTLWNGTADAGEWLDLNPDLTLTSGQIISLNNRIQFTQNTRDDGEYFKVIIEFNDGSNYTSNVFYSSDIFPPVILLESPVNGFTSNTRTVQLDYNVNDIDSGIASCELLINGLSVATDNSITEGITQSFIYTFASNTTYYWDINCTDNSVNANEGSSNENRSIIIDSNEPSIIAFDVFPSNSWDTGSGWLDDWYHIGDSSLQTSGTPYSSPRHLRLRTNTGYVDRAVDLSSYCNPRLEFWAKATGFENGDEAYVMVSHNDSDYYTLKTWVNGEDDGVYHFYEFDLNAFTLSSEFWIAFQSGMNQTNDVIYIDDVNIVEKTPC